MAEFMPPIVAEIRADASQFVTETGKVTASVKEMADKTDSESRNAGDKMVRNFAIGGAIAGVMSSVTSSVMSSMQQLAGEAITASDATDKFKATLKFAGLDTSTIDSVGKATRAYADQTVYDLGTIQNTTAQLAANSVPDYEKLTEAAGNLNAIAGGNKDTFRSVGMVLTQTAGAGKLTTENWNQLADAIPGASGKLQKALLDAGAYTGNFRDAMSQGQITADEFNTAIMQVGTDPIAVEAAKSTETFEGALGNLQATIVGGLSDALSAMKPMITDAIGGLSEILKGVGDGLKWMTDNANISIPILAALGTVLLVALAPAIWGAVTAMVALSVAFLTSPIGIVAMAIGLLVAAIALLAMNWDAVVKWIGDVWNGFIGWLSDSFNALSKWWSDLWNGIGKAINDIWTGIVNWFTDAINAVVSWISDNWGLLLAILTGPIGLAIAWIIENWDGIMKWIHDVIDGFLSWWNGIWESVGKFVNNAWLYITNSIKYAWNVAHMWLMNAIANFMNWWNSTWDKVGSFFSDVWKGIQDALAGAGQWLMDVGKNILQGLWNGLSNAWDWLVTQVKKLFGGLVDVVRNILGIHSPSVVFANIGKNIGEGLVNGISSMSGAVADATSGLSDAVQSSFGPQLSMPGFDAAGVTAVQSSSQVARQLASNQTAQMATPTQQNVTVNVETNASPSQIASSVGWLLRQMG